MLSLITRQRPSSEPAPAGLLDKLQWLRGFGNPSVGVYGRGWNAGITMHTRAAGAEFKISSEFGMSCPEAAVDQLIERVRAALEQQR